MKLIRTDREQFAFHITSKEKELLQHVLELYPLVPETHHRLSKGGDIPNHEENQQLLNEALKAQRTACRQAVEAMLSNPARFTAGGGGFRLNLARGEIEWLLQVLNDVRIGSWIALGSPAYERAEMASPDKKSFRHLMAMEIAGGFQTLFLDAVSGDLLPEQS